MPRALTPLKHRAIIDSIVRRHGASTASFHRAFWPLWEQDLRAESDDDVSLAWFKGHYRFVPDAYRIDLPRLKVVFYEVDVRHATPFKKLQLYAEFALAVACDGWLASLVIADEYGRLRKEDIMRFLPV